MHSLASHLEKLTWERERKKELYLKGRIGLGRLTPPTPQVLVQESVVPSQNSLQEPVVPVGKYLIPLSALEGEPTSSTCLDGATGEELSCRVYDRRFFQSKAALFSAGVRGVHGTREVLLTDSHAFVFSNLSYGDLHQYLREKKKLKEKEAASLFSQIVGLVREAHSRGIALRDIKLKKFVFEDVSR